MKDLQPVNASAEDVSGYSKLTYTSALVEDPIDENHSSNSNLQDDFNSKENNNIRTVIRKKRIQRISDSESDEDGEKSVEETLNKIPNSSSSESDMEDPNIITKNKPKSRIKKAIESGSDSESNDTNKSIKLYERQESRILNKKSKLKQKFKNLMGCRSKGVDMENSKSLDSTHEDSGDSSSEELDAEESSVEKIRQILKDPNQYKSTLCDPDTSDEESSVSLKQKKGKSIKLTSPKPMRMSAKEAMENMHKIKSESNRMLREKEVSLPYHRPKALSLKDIMSRRKPALTPDGKALPIKMNEHQLKQYVLQLEQRQKEMMELCKSDSENEDDNPEDISTNNDSIYDKVAQTNDDHPKLPDIEINETNLVNQIVEDSTIVNNNEDKDDSPMGEDITSSTKDNTNSKNLTEEENSLQESVEQEKSEEQMDISTGSLDNGNESAELKLQYNDSIEKDDEIQTVNNLEENKNVAINNAGGSTELDSQLISLHFDTEKIDLDSDINNKTTNVTCEEIAINEEIKDMNANEDVPDFSDDEINMADIDSIIENAEIIKDDKDIAVDSPMLVKEQALRTMPKLSGAPGMVIDLDGADPLVSKKLSGIELLKERFTYFAKLKTNEEVRREAERRIKPGTQLKKLKQDLEDQMSEQRSIEWAKRLEEEKQLREEMDAITGDNSDNEEDIDNIKAKVKQNKIEGEGEEVKEDESEEESSEEIEEDVEEKSRNRNPMIADEAEESDCDDEGEEINNDGEGGNEDVKEDDENESSDEESEESSEEEVEQSKPRKGRILKAFDDSDEEDSVKIVAGIKTVGQLNNLDKSIDKSACNSDTKLAENTSNPLIKDTQDDDLQLAQMHKSLSEAPSEDIFASQGSSIKGSTDKELNKTNDSEDKDLGTQTFSIMDSHKDITVVPIPENILVTNTQAHLNEDEGNLDHVIPMCSGSFSQNLVTSQYPASQVIGDDVLALCTGKFFENQFVSQVNETNTQMSQIINVGETINNIDKVNETSDVPNDNKGITEDNNKDVAIEENEASHERNTASADTIPSTQSIETVKLPAEDNIFISSILDELGDPELDKPKEHKYFESNKENKSITANMQYKKKFVIDSDDDESETAEKPKKKLFKNRKMEKRALQISDDEDEDEYNDNDDQEEVQEFMSDEEDPDRLVEYDSEENEVTIQPAIKKKRQPAEFFEREAELTSEDEWMGSGDEDEAGLDRMEREAGDDDVFHQGKLQSELEKIHMRDVLDQDKREVRLIQELLFEDGDLGGGGRQRKFRWNNTGGEGDDANPYKEQTDTQEEDVESEEQYRKQRHEREMFLKQMKNEDEDDLLDINISTSIIKPNLSLKSINCSATEKTDSPATEKETAKDIPSPQKPFVLFKQSYHSSLLTRGSGALARLAALALPIAADDDAAKPGSLKPSSKRNFVFAALTPEEAAPKVTKRKAEAINIGTPKLVKKMKKEEKQSNIRKNSLLDHIH